MNYQKLTQDFYNEVAKSWDATRTSPWKGWFKVWDTISPNYTTRGNTESLEILDVGCGNARLADFLATKIESFTYTGIDYSEKLLLQAENRLKKNNKLNYKLINSNIEDVEFTENQGTKSATSKLNNKYDQIWCIAVLHHLENLEEVKSVLEKYACVLKPNGYLIFTFWDFQKIDRLMKRSLELTPNSFLLDWQASGVKEKHESTTEQEVKRFARNYTEKEKQELISYLTKLDPSSLTATKLELTSEFHEDSNLSNHYFILRSSIV